MTDPATTSFNLTSLIMVFAVFLLLIIIFVLIIYFYTRRDSGIRSAARRRRWRRAEARAHFFVSAGNTPAISPAATGLDSTVLSSLPISIYSPIDLKETPECAVCLTDLAGGEKVRFLPICGHGFHLDCIDMWFHSHVTCPICRCPVADGRLPEQRGLGNMVLVEIPVRSPEMVGLSSSATAAAMKSPAEEEVLSPAMARVRSLRRILSRGKKIGGSESVGNPRIVDVESGVMGSGKSNGAGKLGFYEGDEDQK